MNASMQDMYERRVNEVRRLRASSICNSADVSHWTGLIESPVWNVCVSVLVFVLQEVQWIIESSKKVL